MRHGLRHQLLAGVLIGGAAVATAQTPAPVTARLTHTRPASPASTPAVDACLAQARARADASGTDWAGFAHYRDANATLPAPRPDRPRVVFLGDSITAYWNEAARGNSFFPGRPYVNRGISGQRTPQMLLRMAQDVTALRPRVLVLLGGINDIANAPDETIVDEVMNNLGCIAATAAAQGIAVVMASVLPVSAHRYDTRRPDPLGPQPAQRPAARIRALNARLAAYARAHGHVYLDYYSAMADAAGMLHASFSDDDVHPNAAGYAVMAPLAERAIAAALASTAPPARQR